MEIVKRPRIAALVVALALAIASLLVYAAFVTPAAAQQPDKGPATGPQAPSDPALRPVIATESGVVAPGECFVTTQKEMEGPVKSVLEIRDREGNIIEEREVLREMEIIKVISACASQIRAGEGPPTTVSSKVETFVVQCFKHTDLSGGDCHVQRPPPPDLTVHKQQEGPFTRDAPGQGAYIIEVQNVGPGPANPPITVVDTLPVGVTFAGNNLPWTCNVTSGGPPQEVTCTYPQPLGPGDTAVLHLRVDTAFIAAIPPGDNCVRVQHPEDRNPDNDGQCIQTDTSG
ncbi:MAG: hypothetical protein HY678_02685 [Chloroflexi bacterium]|nr:hypothetical protein [Chloroflexota bacterium]